MESFNEVLKNVRNGKTAKIIGSSAELQRAREEIGRLLAGDTRLAMTCAKKALFVYKAIAVTYIKKTRQIPSLRSNSPRSISL